MKTFGKVLTTGLLSLMAFGCGNEIKEPKLEKTMPVESLGHGFRPYYPEDKVQLQVFVYGDKYAYAHKVVEVRAKCVFSYGTDETEYIEYVFRDGKNHHINRCLDEVEIILSTDPDISHRDPPFPEGKKRLTEKAYFDPASGGWYGFSERGLLNDFSRWIHHPNGYNGINWEEFLEDNAEIYRNIGKQIGPQIDSVYSSLGVK